MKDNFKLVDHMFVPGGKYAHITWTFIAFQSLVIAFVSTPQLLRRTPPNGTLSRSAMYVWVYGRMLCTLIYALIAWFSQPEIQEDES